MLVESIYNPDVITIDPKDNISKAAELMKSRHVGSLIVINQGGDNGSPLGILTDRDIAIEYTPSGTSSESLIVEDLMARNPVLIKKSESLEKAIELMSQNGVRRLPVVDENQDLVGILSADDIVRKLSQELESLSQVIQSEIMKERNQGVAAARQ